MRRLLALVALSLLLVSASAAQEIRGSIISDQMAQRYGLKKAWVAQAHIDRAFDQMVGFAIDGDALFVLSQSGILQSIDAETGTTRWVYQYGDRNHPATGPGVGDRYVAITKGSYLFVIDRTTGARIFEKSLTHTPTASPTVFGEFVYVPLFNSMIVAYDMEHPKRDPWFYRGTGHINVPALATPNCLAWSSSRGYIYASPPDHLHMRFQFHANGPIVSPMSYSPPLIYATARDGFAYALDENNGDLKWRFSAGDPITHQPVAIRDSVFVIPEAGGMYCLEHRSGQQKWYAPRVRQFLAASPNRAGAAGANDAQRQSPLGRIYAADESGNTLVLDAGSGARLDSIPTAGLPWKFTNTVNDRLYLGSRSGLIQCLHEIGLNTPTSFVPKVTPPPADGEAADAPRRDDEPMADEVFDEPDFFDPFDDGP